MKHKIHIDAWNSSLNKKGEELCGDKVVSKLNDESFIMVLADGLGSGVKANILSTLTSTIISEMIFEGASLSETVETVAKTLPVCQERQVAYSTFTVIQIFYDGHAKLIEFDNPLAICIRDGQILAIDRQERIYNQKKIYEASFEVLNGDYITFFSDGIIHAGVGQKLNFGWQHEEVAQFLQTYTSNQDSAKEIVRILLANVNYLYDGQPGDDSTVACIKMLEAKETIVMVGPPSNKEDDASVVERLLAATGLKICCGGTTSTIVSRYLNKPLETDPLIDFDSDVPPKGFIEGIDLVTEGVLSLQKVNRYLSKCVKDDSFLEQLLQSKQTDGATCLVQAFLAHSTMITFMVGLSDNPAHEAIAYSTISLNAKIQLIKDMADKLHRLKKIVKIEMY
ncbi:MAG: serine/threonine-protein phosphatase [Erysipelotrichaceae bacterium]|nr:serine/threonine-protein phosphatase [Erysipelotrichaceae bacterium]MDY5252010.1 SpoIIE family protein phosphatase [Erysipelotrichaceae bacterium]